jgi:hypothetical protein
VARASLRRCRDVRGVGVLSPARPERTRVHPGRTRPSRTSARPIAARLGNGANSHLTPGSPSQRQHGSRESGEKRCQESTETVSTISRDGVKHQPIPIRQGSAELAEILGGAGGARIHDPGIMSTSGLRPVPTCRDAARGRACEVVSLAVRRSRLRVMEDDSAHPSWWPGRWGFVSQASRVRPSQARDRREGQPRRRRRRWRRSRRGARTPWHDDHDVGPGERQLDGCVSGRRLRGVFSPSHVIAVPVGGTPPVHHDGAAHCCLRASARSAKDGGPKARRRVSRKADQVVVATLSAATAYLISMLIRPLVLVARMRVHVRMDPESAYHRLLGHEGRYVLRPPVSRVEGPSPATP